MEEPVLTESTNEQNEIVENSSFYTSNGEYLQRKLYFLLEHLKKMHSDLPEYVILNIFSLFM